MPQRGFLMGVDLFNPKDQVVQLQLCSDSQTQNTGNTHAHTNVGNILSIVYLRSLSSGSLNRKKGLRMGSISDVSITNIIYQKQADYFIKLGQLLESEHAASFGHFN